jgi:hypothetical protein
MLLKARIGQGIFRSKPILLWNGQCSVTSCGLTSAFVASHIVPWTARKTNAERLDANNGLVLTAKHTFDLDGKLLLLDGLATPDLRALGIPRSMQIRRPLPGNLPYLERHREEFFYH